MNNIYRRKPIQHRLPADYNKIDNIQYFNINNIGGLQVYDNPLAADQNSTYNCKNVYRDELGNLTVRPQVWYSLESIASPAASIDTMWFIKTDYGKVYVKRSPENNTLSIIDLDGNAHDTTISGNGKVTMQETGDGLYFLINKDDSLQLWKFDKENNFGQVTGEIQINDQGKLNFELYNILNDKTYNRTYDIPAGIRLPAYYDEISTKDTSEIGTTTNVRVIQLKSGQFLVLSDTLIKLYTYKNYQWYTTDIQRLGIDTIPFSTCKFTIDDKSETEESVILTFCFETTNNVKMKRYNISLSGSMTLLSANSVTKSSLSDYTLAYPLFDNYWITVSGSNTTSPVLRIYLENNVKYTKELLYSITDMTTDKLNFLATDRYFVLIAPYDTTHHYVYSGWEYKTGTAAFDGSFGKYWSDTSGPHAPSSSLSQSYCDTKIAVLADATYGNLYILDNEQHITVNANDNLYSLKVSGDSTGTSIPKVSVSICDNVTTYTIPGDTTAIYTIDLDTYVQQQYSFLGTYDQASLNSDGTSLVLCKQKGSSVANAIPPELILRSVKPTDTEVDRPTDKIPVLSQFNENILTSFFLDGYYWFVTDKHVFGTGSANGHLTIEYFDPLKYYAFTERLTAAMRISDTSFWVFHNEGAYLIYKSAVKTEDGTEYRWLCTNTAKSKGCDFDNAIVTLPITSAVSVVTAEDICSVEMKENIQSDERLLVPMTLNMREMIRSLLETTSHIEIATYHYLTIFFLNRALPTDNTPAVVFDSSTSSWWYWEFPFKEVKQVTQTETNVKIMAVTDLSIIGGEGEDQGIYNLAEDQFTHSTGVIDYEVYADKLSSDKAIKQISWQWDSAILLFGTLDFRKQLLFTTFVFDDYNIPDDALSDKSLVNFEYYFNIYSRKYASTSPQVTMSSVERVTNNACKTMIANYNYLQLILRNRRFEDDEYEALTKPKICSISMKYRILRGGLT